MVPGGASRGGFRGGLAAARWGWQRLDEVSGTSAVIDRLEMDSVYVLRVRGCNKAGYGEYSEEVYLHTPPAPGEMRVHLTDTVPGGLWHGEIQLDTTEHVTTRTLHNGLTLNKIDGSMDRLIDRLILLIPGWEITAVAVHQLFDKHCGKIQLIIWSPQSHWEEVECIIDDQEHLTIKSGDLLKCC